MGGLQWSGQIGLLRGEMGGMRLPVTWENVVGHWWEHLVGGGARPFNRLRFRRMEVLFVGAMASIEEVIVGE